MASDGLFDGLSECVLHQVPLVKALAGRLHLYERRPERVLSLPFEWPQGMGDPADAGSTAAQLHSLLTTLSDPSEMLTLLVTPSPLQSPSTERWYATPYELQPLPKSIRRACAMATPHPELRLPPPNPYVPSDLSMLEQVSVMTSDDLRCLPMTSCGRG